MKHKVITLCAVIFILAVPAVFSLDSRIFNVSVEYPDQGKIGSAINPLYPDGTVVVPVGDYTRFFLTGYSGYEPAGFTVNGQYVEGGLYEYRVEQAGDPITVIGKFREIRDTVGPAMHIVYPNKSSSVQIGAEDTVSLVVYSYVNYETDTPSFELYRNGALLQIAPEADQTTPLYRFENIPLAEGDNLFMVRANDRVSRDNYMVDFTLVHYSSTPDVSATRAAILVDPRLYSEPGIGEKLLQYASLAGARISEDFVISVEQVAGIDDWSTDQVRNYIADLKTQAKALEGVVLVGNIKLPSFYRPRADIEQSRLVTNKYEDFDLVLRKDGGALADYDYMEKGPNPLPDIWCAVMPVGKDDLPENNTYAAYAGQLAPYLDKLVNGYSTIYNNGGLYQLSDRLRDLNTYTAMYGLGSVSFNSVNDTGLGPYQWYAGVTPETFYKPVESSQWFDFHQMSNYAKRFPAMGEGWQSKDIFMNRMNDMQYGIVWTDVLSSEGESLVTADEAKTLQNGGFIQLLSGSGVGGFKQYGSASYTDASVYPDGNILCGYAYGSSLALAALGCPFDRGHESEFEKLSAFVAQGDYLGKAHFFRKCLQYQNAGASPDDFKMAAQEILVGDPFVKIGDETEQDGLPPSVPQNVVCTGTDITSVNITWDPSMDDREILYYYCVAEDSYGYQMMTYTNGPETSATITYLDPNTTYTLTVQAVDGWGNYSAPSAPVMATTLPFEGQFPAPQNFVCTDNEDSMITVAWDLLPAEYSVYYYDISFKKAGDYDSRWQSWDGSSTLRIEGLLPNTEYMLRIRAVDANYVGGLWSASITVVTSAAVPPSVPQNLRATDVTETSIAIEWDASTDDTGVSGYEILYIYPNDEQFGSWTEGNSFYLDGLSPDTTYVFRVKAYDVAWNRSEWSSQIAVTTDRVTPPTAPANVRATQINERSVSLSWDPSFDESGISYYEIVANGVDGSFSSTTVYETAVTLYGLEPSTTYTVTVRAYDGYGSPGDASEPLVIETLPVIPPSIPQNLVASNVDIESITVSWDPSTDNIGIAYYYIRYTDPNGQSRYASTSLTTVTITNLVPSTPYSINVQAFDVDNDTSNWSDTLTVTTLDPPPDWTPSPSPTPMVTYIPPPTPTPTAVATATPEPGRCWIVPANQTVVVGSDAYMEIHASTGTSLLGSFGFTITYPAEILAPGNILEIPAGLNLVVDTAVPGSVIVTGSNETGLSGSANLALVRIFLTTSSVGSGPISLTVNSLADTSGNPIGIPSGTGGSVSVVENPTPEPTPEPTLGPTSPPGIGLGQCWIDPSSQSAYPGYTVTFEIHANTGSIPLCAFGFTIGYPAELFAFQSISEITSGCNITTNAGTAGSIVLAGFNVNGLPASEDLALARITLVTKDSASGNASVTLAVDTLADYSGDTIGNPSGIGAVIDIAATIPTSVPTAAPTAVPTVVPTMAPTAGPTAVPTSTPVAGAAGRCWISPASQTVDAGSAVTVEIHADTGTSPLGSFGFTVTYPAGMFSAGSIAEMTPGLNLVTNTSTEGTIMIAGFNASGIPGSTDLKLVRITLYASPGSSGSATVSLTVNSLWDSNGTSIGSPYATGGTITVSSSATPAPTAAPTVIPTSVPTAIPTATPLAPTAVPTAVPTEIPTSEPTAIPTAEPTLAPTAEPTEIPTAEPTPVPSMTPCPHKTPRPHKTPKPTITPASLPDLVPERIEVAGELKAGSTITLESGVTNTGNKESGQFKVMWTVNYMSVIGGGTCENVQPGVTLSDSACEARWTPARYGKYVIMFIVDPRNKVKESGERNNVSYKTIYVRK